MNPIVHFEINAPKSGDKKALQDFYANTFGWRIDASNPMGYGLAYPDGNDEPKTGINGAVDASQDDNAGVILYIGVDDLDASLAQINAAGGQTLMPPTEVPGLVWFALFKDPAGNTLGLVKNETPA